MAYFEQRSNDWSVQVRRTGAPSISRTFDLKADAEAWAREVEREHQRGNVMAMRNDAGKVTLGEVAGIYMVAEGAAPPLAFRWDAHPVCQGTIWQVLPGQYLFCRCRRVAR